MINGGTLGASYNETVRKSTKKHSAKSGNATRKGSTALGRIAKHVRSVTLVFDPVLKNTTRQMTASPPWMPQGCRFRSIRYCKIFELSKKAEQRPSQQLLALLAP